jgi:hypothetical protein
VAVSCTGGYVDDIPVFLYQLVNPIVFFFYLLKMYAWFVKD